MQHSDSNVDMTFFWMMEDDGDDPASSQESIANPPVSQESMANPPSSKESMDDPPSPSITHTQRAERRDREREECGQNQDRLAAIFRTRQKRCRQAPSYA